MMNRILPAIVAALLLFCANRGMASSVEDGVAAHLHFHVEYKKFSTVIAIDSGDVLEGDLPRNKMKVVQA